MPKTKSIFATDFEDARGQLLDETFMEFNHLTETEVPLIMSHVRVDPCYGYFIDDITKSYKNGKFNLIHLNINSLHPKISEVNDILKLNLFEFFSINETKLDASKPAGFYKNNRYNIIRRDRCHGSTDLATKGGGIIIFIKKQYHIEYSFISDGYELIHIKLKIDNKLFNFICSYKSPKVNQSDFIEYLENYILNILPFFYLVY
jgi:hypothetical protein